MKPLENENEELLEITDLDPEQQEQAHLQFSKENQKKKHSQALGENEEAKESGNSIPKHKQSKKIKKGPKKQLNSEEDEDSDDAQMEGQNYGKFTVHGQKKDKKKPSGAKGSLQ